MPASANTSAATFSTCARVSLQLFLHANERDHDLRDAALCRSPSRPRSRLRRLREFASHRSRETRSPIDSLDARASGWLPPIPQIDGGWCRNRLPGCPQLPAFRSSLCGRNSCSGGSSNRIVTGNPAMIIKSWRKSSRWNGKSRSSAARRAASVLDMIICRTARMRSGAKNMCSVRHRPMPSAPNLRAVSASSGVSALARTPIRRHESAHSIKVPKSPEIVGSIIATEPRNTSPVAPSKCDRVTCSDVAPASCQHLTVVVDCDPTCAGNARPSHPPCDDCGVASHTPACRQNPSCGMHAVDIFRTRLHPNQNDCLALCSTTFSLVRTEDDHSRSGARAGGQSFCQQRARGLRVKHWM